MRARSGVQDLVVGVQGAGFASLTTAQARRQYPSLPGPSPSSTCALWDALGRTADGEVVLVEAKANIPELVSGGTGASLSSRQLIEQSLSATKEYLRVPADIPWSGRLYQYANRLAHFYFLRELNGIPAYMAFVYFTGDDDVNGPQSIEGWQAASAVAKGVLGINKRNRLSRYTGEVYIDVNVLV